MADSWTLVSEVEGEDSDWTKQTLLDAKEESCAWTMSTVLLNNNAPDQKNNWAGAGNLAAEEFRFTPESLTDLFPEDAQDDSDSWTVLSEPE